MLQLWPYKRRRVALLFGVLVAALLPWLIAKAAAPAQLDWRRELAWPQVRTDGERFAQPLRDGTRIELTLNARLQGLTDQVLLDYGAQYAGAVMLSVDDGRVLAMAGRSTVEPGWTAADLTLQAWAPAASVFKLVTAAALVEAGVTPREKVCYHDGRSSVEPSNLQDEPELDQNCNSLAYALAKSQNAIIGRLAHDHLNPERLDRTGRALGFGASLPFELPVAASEMAVPDRHDPLGFARMASGFWQTTLSPMHGAWLAATIARGGETPPLTLVERIVDKDGHMQVPGAAAPRRALSENAARAVAKMMVGTTEFGSARRSFRDPRTHRPLLPGIAVAGKTGTLFRKDPFLAYSWFVGFAPAHRPEVAIAVLLADGENPRIAAHEAARDLLAGYFEGAKAPRVASR